MRLVLFIAGLCLSAITFAADLAGAYIFEGPNGTIGVKFDVKGAVLTGVLQVGGQPFAQFAGTAQGSTGRGTATSRDGDGGFEASVDGDVLDLVLTQEAGPNRQAGRLPLRLTRIGAVTAPPPVATGLAGDIRLVGNWVAQDVITSGNTSMATEEYLAFRADGSFLYGKGRSVAGGGDWSWESGGAGAERGQWRAADGVLFAQPASGQWARVGRYGMTDDGSTMRITTDQGEKKLWSRRK